MNKISVQDNPYFFYSSDKFGKYKYSDKKEKEIVKIYNTAKFNKNGDLLSSRYHSLSKYKNMYQYKMFQMFKDEVNDDYYVTRKYIFDKKFKHQVHSLDIDIDDLKQVKSLPKELIALKISLHPETKFNVSVLPKGLLSLKALGRNTLCPFNGKNFRKLTKLQYIGSSGMISIFPKLPKNIEYIQFIRSRLGYGSNKEELKNFKLSDFPNLKLFDLRESGFIDKTVPKEWLKAKKDKKLHIYW